MQRQLLTLAVVVLVMAPMTAAQQVTFQQAVALALKQAKAVSAARADHTRAQEAYLEARNAYIPQLSLGSGVGYTFGFPLGTPSVFNITSYSLLYNPSQREYLRAARFSIASSESTLEDKRQQAILDTALAYADLDRTLSAIALIKNEQDVANNSLNIAQQRVQAGVEPAVEITRAKLNIARANLKFNELQGNADLLRLRLSQLTGLSAAGLATVPDSLPNAPSPPMEEIAASAVAQNPSVHAADEDAHSKERAAQAERKQIYYPQVNLAAQYARFSNLINNYSAYFKNFSPNNVAFGLEIKVPFFNLSQRSKYREAEATAERSRIDAESARDELTSEVQRLERAVQQLSAAQDIAQLDYELSQGDISSTEARMENGQASPQDLQSAQLAAQEKQAALLDARFNYLQARLQLMRLTGDLEGWAKVGGAPAP